MANLILPSLEIQNFRAFEHLRIERLGRVNLITGKNNVGKTSLLEAIYLYARDGSALVLSDLLEAREELNRPSNSAQALHQSDYAKTFFNFRYLFHGRKDLSQLFSSITIGPIDGSKVKVSVITDRLPNEEGFVPYIAVQSAVGELRSISATYFLSPNVFLSSENIHIRCRYVRANGWRTEDLSRMWDSVMLTPDEDVVLRAIEIVTPPAQRIGFIGKEDGSGDRTPVMLLSGMSKPVPLRSLGEGVNRLLGIALAITTANEGILLIDEVETGLHYSVMLEVWKLIFQVAQRLNVQVFATTHSWDCIEAFQQAAEEDKTEEALLIRLENFDGDITATLFDERRLSIAARELIEVR